MPEEKKIAPAAASGNKKEKKAENNEAQAKTSKFEILLEKAKIQPLKVGDLVSGEIISASKQEALVDILGIYTGVVRGPELYSEDDTYANLKPGDKVEATLIEEENENGELELSFRASSEEKAWDDLTQAYTNKEIIKIKIISANKGGLLANFRQISGFLPVSQLAPENYPRVSGGDKTKIFEKLKSFAGRELKVKIATFNPNEDKIIFSEKEAWVEQQKDNISKYKVGAIVDGVISAIADFGVFVNFDTNLEGLIHISELAWQRIDHPGDLYKVGDNVKAEIISMSNSKIFLSVKKLLPDPWKDIERRYKIGQKTKGKIIKINPFGLFIELDKEIHGLAHISQLGLNPGQRINDLFSTDEEKIFVITSLQPKAHRLGLAVARDQEDPSSTKASEGETNLKKEPKEGKPAEDAQANEVKAKKVSKDKQASDDKKAMADKQETKKTEKKTTEVEV